MRTRSKRQKFTDEFKADTVKMVIEADYSCNETARRLGINPSNVTRWVREHRDEQEAAAAGGKTKSELDAEIRRLKKENKRLEMERDILKKATAFFAKQSD